MTVKPDEISRWADVYFNRTKRTVEKFGDVSVTYAVFMRRPVVLAPKLAIDWLNEWLIAWLVDVSLD